MASVGKRYQREQGTKGRGTIPTKLPDPFSSQREGQNTRWLAGAFSVLLLAAAVGVGMHLFCRTDRQVEELSPATQPE